MDCTTQVVLLWLTENTETNMTITIPMKWRIMTCKTGMKRTYSKWIKIDDDGDNDGRTAVGILCSGQVQVTAMMASHPSLEGTRFITYLAEEDP